jgi:hypothetical protein
MRGKVEKTGDCDAGGEEAPDGHAADLQILSRKEKVNPSCWFTMASDSVRLS